MGSFLHEAQDSLCSFEGQDVCDFSLPSYHHFVPIHLGLHCKALLEGSGMYYIAHSYGFYFLCSSSSPISLLLSLLHLPLLLPPSPSLSSSFSPLLLPPPPHVTFSLSCLFLSVFSPLSSLPLLYSLLFPHFISSLPSSSLTSSSLLSLPSLSLLSSFLFPYILSSLPSSFLASSPLPSSHTFSSPSPQFTQYALSTFRVHNFQSVIQSLISILETALHNVYCPLGGIVMLAGMWYKVFQGYSQRVRASAYIL